MGNGMWFWGEAGRELPSLLRVLLAGSTLTRRTPALERGSRSKDFSVTRPDTSHLFR